MRAWSLLAVGNRRQYGGNTGYADDPASVYRYDSDVANHRNVAQGDLVVIRSRTAVLGFGRIEHIHSAPSTKTRQRCPYCLATSIKERTGLTPRWRCTRGHAFEEPASQLVNVTSYEAHYERSYVAAEPAFTLARLNAAVIRPSDQMSIKEIDPAVIEDLMDGLQGRRLVESYVASLRADETDRSAESRSIIEERRRVLREIQVRRGQTGFRKRLIERYGCRCMVTGCELTSIIEAAHISPYSLSSDNSADNGLLLRSDIHTLFDLGLMGFEPDTHVIRFADAVRIGGYDSFEGRTLIPASARRPDRAALEARWSFFLDVTRG